MDQSGLNFKAHAPETGAKLKQFRNILGMTQDEFSSVLGEKPSKIRDIETARQRVNDAFISKLVMAFEVDLNWLFSNERFGSQPAPNPARVQNGQGRLMVMTRSDIKAQAAGLPDFQRIALGLELILTVESGDRWTEVRQAGVEALRHSELLSLDRVRQVPRIEINPPATTHEQFNGGFKAGPRDAGTARVASLWEWIKRSNDTLLGDFIGGLALILMFLIGLFAVGVYDGTM